MLGPRKDQMVYPEKCPGSKFVLIFGWGVFFIPSRLLPLIPQQLSPRNRGTPTGITNSENFNCFSLLFKASYAYSSSSLSYWLRWVHLSQYRVLFFSKIIAFFIFLSGNLTALLILTDASCLLYLSVVFFFHIL